MKKIGAMIVGLILTVGLFGVGVASAADIRHDQNVTVDREQTVDSSLYAAGSTVVVAGTVQGDLFCAGQNVEITGTVEGDVLCAAQMVRIEGTVFGDVRVAAQTATIGGAVNGAMTTATQSLYTSDKSEIGGDVTAVGESLTLAGRSGRDVVAGANTITFSGEIARNVDASAEAVTLEPTARVAGNLMYTSPADATTKDGAVVSGSVERKEPPKDDSRDEAVAAYIIMPLYWFAALLLVGLAGLLIAPKFLDGPVNVLRRRPLASLGFGLVGLLATPIVAIFLMFTTVGILLGVLIMLAWLVSLVSGFIVAAYCTGRMLAERIGWKQWQRVLSMTLGLLVLVILSALPYVGGLIAFASIAWGIGSKLIWLYGHSAAAGKKRAKAKA